MVPYRSNLQARQLRQKGKHTAWFAVRGPGTEKICNELTFITVCSAALYVYRDRWRENSSCFAAHFQFCKCWLLQYTNKSDYKLPEIWFFFLQNNHIELLQLGGNKLCEKVRLQRSKSASILCCTYVHFLPHYSYKAFDKNAALVVPSQREIRIHAWNGW
jgi:hypothetical protein